VRNTLSGVRATGLVFTECDFAPSESSEKAGVFDQEEII
jgi:hypothetical protein